MVLALQAWQGLRESMTRCRPNASSSTACGGPKRRSVPTGNPTASQMVVTISPVNGYINVQVDGSAPQAWRKQP